MKSLEEAKVFEIETPHANVSEASVPVGTLESTFSSWRWTTPLAKPQPSQASMLEAAVGIRLMTMGTYLHASPTTSTRCGGEATAAVESGLRRFGRRIKPNDLVHMEVHCQAQKASFWSAGHATAKHHDLHAFCRLRK